MSFRTLELELAKGVKQRPEHLEEMRIVVADMQSRRGQPYQVSTAGQTVILGG